MDGGTMVESRLDLSSLVAQRERPVTNATTKNWDRHGILVREPHDSLIPTGPSAVCG